MAVIKVRKAATKDKKAEREVKASLFSCIGEKRMREFYETVRERKALVASSKHVKRGSKSKKCTLPHENITKREWQRMNGEVKMYNYQKPLTFEEFRELPVDLAAQHIAMLQEEDTFNASVTMIARYMRTAPPTLRKYLLDHNIPFIQKTFTGRVGKDCKEKLDTFYQVATAEPSPAEEEASTKERTSYVEKTAGMPLTNIDLEFAGIFDSEAICNTLKLMIPDGTPCSVTLRICKEV